MCSFFYQCLFLYIYFKHIKCCAVCHLMHYFETKYCIFGEHFKVTKMYVCVHKDVCMCMLNGVFCKTAWWRQLCRLVCHQSFMTYWFLGNVLCYIIDWLTTSFMLYYKPGIPQVVCYIINLLTTNFMLYNKPGLPQVLCYIIKLVYHKFYAIL